MQVVWEGGARTELTVALVKRGTERNRTSEDTIELVRKLAAHTGDQQIAAILNKQGRRTRYRPAIQPAMRRVHPRQTRDPGRTATRARQ